LLLFYSLGPVELLQAVEQPLGIVRYAQHPLLEVSPDDFVAALLVGAVGQHLLIGADDAAGGAVPYLGVIIVGQPSGVDIFFSGLIACLDDVKGYRHLVYGASAVGLVVIPCVVELKEDPLCPFEVGRVGGVDLAVPVVAQPQLLYLPAEGVAVFIGGDGRVGACLYGVLFSREPEGVPSHGVKHVVALHALVACHDVSGGVALGVTYVQSCSGGVWEHVKDIELIRVGEIVRGPEGLVLLPVLLPFSFYLCKVILLHVGCKVCAYGVRN